MTTPAETRSVPDFPYGGVYYRVSGPPRADWERDYKAASADGCTAFRQWLLWSAVQRKPGEDYWEDYDTHLDLAARYGISTIIAEMLTSAPDWVFHTYPDARLEHRNGTRLASHQGASTGTAGFPGLCLDHPELRALAGDFLTRLARRYRSHPGLGGYDVWNECSLYTADLCFCPATTAKFRSWLQAKYTDVDALAEAWSRFGLRSFADVEAPRAAGAYPEVLDWLEFRADNAQELLRWRVSLIRAADPDHAITAHGLGRMPLNAAAAAVDDWRSAAAVDSFGFTWVASRHDGQPWRHYQAADLTRSAADGKPFWHSEAQGGPLWLQPQVLGRPRDDGRIPTAGQVRLWLLQSLATGARGIFFPRWRPLLRGPLFSAFAPYATDGSPTERSIAASEVARWFTAPEQFTLREATPIRGEIALLFLPEAQRLDYAQVGEQAGYPQAADAAYRAMFTAGLQPDWITIARLDEYRHAYLPYPVALSAESVDALTRWVEAGGTLITEAAPGYFDNAGGVTLDPRGGSLLRLCGVREAETEFTPDLWSDIRLVGPELAATGALIRQSYELAGAAALAHYSDGAVAAAVNRTGRGRAIILGSSLPLGATLAGADPATIRPVLSIARVTRAIQLSNEAVTGRIHACRDRRFVWITNPTDSAQRVSLKVPESLKYLHVHRGDPQTVLGAPMGGDLACVVPEHDAVVLSFESVPVRSRPVGG